VIDILGGVTKEEGGGTHEVFRGTIFPTGMREVQLSRSWGFSSKIF
jgi:hypothetical protein